MGVIGSSIDFIKEHPIGSAIIGGGTAVAIGATAVAVSRARSSKSKTTRKKTTKKTTKRKSKRKKTNKSKRVRRTPRTAGKGKDRSTRRIRYTKKGQPYVIMKSGKARFIKKSSAKRSHKLKGGRY